LLIKQLADELGSRVKVVTEEYGNSPMASRFGVRRYPVVFVDDVLVARPKDFGFAGPEDSGGRYVPWREPANQERFKADLRAMVVRRLRGERIEGVPPDTESTEMDGPAQMPDAELRTISGTPIDPATLRGRVVVVEMWATWCPPCRSTLAWLNELRSRRQGQLEVVAIAIDSPAADVRDLTASLKLTYPVVLATPAVIERFGAVAAVPKLLVFDRDGRRTAVLHGAPPDLHETVERLLANR
jgi:thiol-disulfide isomerase/thioredoxin